MVLWPRESNFAVALPDAYFSWNVVVLHFVPVVLLPVLVKWMVPVANGDSEPAAMVTAAALDTWNALRGTEPEMLWLINAGLTNSE
jgi:hypothetical protein